MKQYRKNNQIKMRGYSRCRILEKGQKFIIIIFQLRRYYHDEFWYS